MMNLQLIFGMTMTNLSMYLRFGRHIMIHVLKNDTHASITIPSKEKIIEYKQQSTKNIQSLRMSGPQWTG